MIRHTFLVIASLLIVGAATASPIDVSTVTIVNATPAYQGYGTEFALDRGEDYRLTDYASNGGGNNTFLDFDFGRPYEFTTIRYTNRVTSGGVNGVFLGGSFDFVTDFKLIFFSDPAFTNVIGSVDVQDLAPPDPPVAPVYFQTDVNVTDLTARYMRWQVLSTAGANPGVSNFEFDGIATPEPATLALTGALLLGLGLARRWKRSA